MDGRQRIRELLRFIYGERICGTLYPELLGILKDWREGAGSSVKGRDGGGTGPGGPPPVFGGGDVLLISYGDMLSPSAESAAGMGSADGGESAAGGGAVSGTKNPAEGGLARLSRFLARWNDGAFTYLHILPFHPYSSDDGFSVIDYREVDPRFGGWDDVAELGRRFRLVFDFVLNHGSVESPWFKGFLAGDPQYAHWYITRPGDYDGSGVFRPRTHPLLTPFTRSDGSPVYVWTTFSADQADYDFSHPPVFLESVRLLLEYARRGGRIIRLDAIAYLWKEDGTPCLHHPRTHGMVKLFRAIIDFLGLDLLILTETNVPHRENVAYFGEWDGSRGDEAHLVYNFALPPLVLHAMISGDARPLSAWAKTLPGPVAGQGFLNFLASHDGVGLGPARGLVDEGAFGATIREAVNRGALVSYKTAQTGQGPVEIPYELNCSYVAVIAPASLGDPAVRARAFLASQAILLALAGLPAVYFHSWIGSEAWEEGPGLLGYNRAINREKPPIDRVEREMADPGSLRSRIHRGFKTLLDFRRAEEAFRSDSPQQVLEGPSPVFALLRGPPAAASSGTGETGGARRALCLQNVCGEPAAFKVPADIAADIPPGIASKGEIALAPWETRWIAFGGAKGGNSGERQVSTCS
ncbi:MAG: sugar phosphorylase [Treponema sp.]|jgi:sucrose phosphorylase|nr:sugar phosphorylase [Treponema sp.]